MRKAWVLFLLVLLVVGAYAGLYGLRSGWFGTQPGLQNAALPDAGPAPASTSSAAARPTFDIVRAEPDGSVIMAGRAEPGWTVSVQSGGKEIGSVAADENGEWIVQPTERLAKGEYSLELSAQAPKGDRTLFSTQRLALSLADPKTDQPLVALTEEGKATRVLQMPAAADTSGGAAKRQSGSFETATLNVPEGMPGGKAGPGHSAQVGFASVDYEEAGEKSMLHMSGQGVPGTRVMLYIDNEFAGMATADATGNWSYSGNRQLSGGNHALRADLLQKDANIVMARAEVRFDRAPGGGFALAEDDSKTAGLDGAVSGKANPSRAGSSVEEGAKLVALDGSAIIVRRGDTLWQIAQRHYGNGAKYTQIFQNNRKQIRNPNLIYPMQRFELPR